MRAMARPRKLLVFDLETVPDVALARTLWEPCREMDDAATTQYIWDIMREANGGKSDFPRLPFHQVVAIGCLQASIVEGDGGSESYHLERLGCIGEEGDDESALLHKWYAYCEKAAANGTPVRLVGFNSRGFDVPVLKMRALKHGIRAPWLFQSGDKWSNYNARYDTVWHVDVLDCITDFGAARGPGKLDEICTLAGLPGKLDIEGSKVGELFAAGQVGVIRDYCETDVLNTYLLYLKYQRLAGYLHGDALAREEQLVREYCAKEGAARSHLASFLAAWPEAGLQDDRVTGLQGAA